MTKITRRNFLQFSAGAVAASGIVGSSGCSGSRGPDNLAMLIDCTLCDGCVDYDIPLCVAACRERAIGRIPEPVDPIPRLFPRGRIEDWSERKDVHDRLTPYTQLYVQRVDVDRNDGRQTVYLPRRCMHCDNPACATVCPFTANHKFPNGAVVINSNLCIGGAKCRDVCPWQIPQRQSGVGIYLHFVPSLAGNGVMFKCDLCYDRVQQSRLPLCVEACPRYVMVFGLRKDIAIEAHRRAERTGGYLYGEHENGGTGTIYLSPVPFEDIDQVLVKGPGQPHFERIERRFAKATSLETSVLMAPIVGAGAGMAAAVLALKKRSGDTGGGEKDG